MSKIFADFQPAELRIGKETYISYYVKNPFTEQFVRKRVKLNHISSATERKKYGRLLVQQINDKLYDGWNPFIEEAALSNGLTLDVAINNFLIEKKKDLRPDTFRAYSSIAKIFLEWLQQNNLSNKYCFLFNKQFAHKFLNSLSQNPKICNRTYNNYLRFLKTLFTSFEKKEIVKENVFVDFESKKQDEKIRVTIPAEDRLKIKDYFLTNMPNYYLIMLLCFRLFIRPKEILMLKVKYVNYKEALLTIPSIVSKNHNERILALPEELLILLNKYENVNPEYYIFSDYNTLEPGKQLLNSKRIGYFFSRMRLALDLPSNYQFYSLKDTGITEMLEMGVPPKFVKELADHHSLEMTEKYTHKSNAKKILEYNKLQF